jgi:hypothetical protein
MTGPATRYTRSLNFEHMYIHGDERTWPLTQLPNFNSEHLTHLPANHSYLTSLADPFRLYITAYPWDTNRFWSFSADRVWPFSSCMTPCDLFTVDTLRLMSKISKSTARGAYLLSFWLLKLYKKRSFILYLKAETCFCRLKSKGYWKQLA